LLTFKILFSQINPAEHESELIEFVKKFGDSEYCSQKKSAINLTTLLFKHLSKDNKIILAE
jgi:hypothetical protein